MSTTSNNPIKLALLSCGLGNVSRGFEVSTARWYQALKNEPGIDLRLYCGGQHDGGKVVWNITRDSLLKGPMRYFFLLNDRRRWEMCYGIEQISFGLSLLPDLLKDKPDIVWTKEAPLAHLLDFFRLTFNLQYKIIFANGGAFRPSTYRQFDYIQHLHMDSYEQALEAGLPDSKMCVIPNCVPSPDAVAARDELRREFGYEADDWIVICVAAWNRYHKRLDYLIEEVAAMNDPRVKLLLCGQPEPESDGLQQLAKQKLGSRVSWRTLSESQVRRALEMSDAFVLASLNEGLGSVIIEAAMARLPIVVHNHGGAKYILQDEHWTRDLTQSGELTQRLSELREAPPAAEELDNLRHRVSTRFDERALARQFGDMVRRVNNEPKSGYVSAAHGMET
jgi:1,2-diacylglycerol 3-alpha-glucosyltransferase